MSVRPVRNVYVVVTMCRWVFEFFSLDTAERFAELNDFCVIHQYSEKDYELIID